MKIIIAGAYAIGSHLAKLLSRNNQDIVLIDDDEQRLENISSDYDILTMHASPTSLAALKNAGAAEANLYIAVTPDENLNMNSCVMAKAIGAKKTVAKVNNYEFVEPEMAKFYEKLGIDSLIYPENLAAYDIVNGLKMSWVRQRWDVHGGALVMLGIKLRETCEILDRPLKEHAEADTGKSELVKARLLGNQCVILPQTRIVGCCHNLLHPGKLTKRLMTQHDCLGKNCRHFEKYEDAGYWKESDRKKEQKRTARQLQRMKRKQEAATEAILQNLAELFQSYIEEYQQRVRK